MLYSNNFVCAHNFILYRYVGSSYLSHIKNTSAPFAAVLGVYFPESLLLDAESFADTERCLGQLRKKLVDVDESTSEKALIQGVTESKRKVFQRQLAAKHWYDSSCDRVGWTSIAAYQPPLPVGDDKAPVLPSDWSFDASVSWSVVVVGRSKHFNIWCPQGFPMGFSELSLSPKFHSYLTAEPLRIPVPASLAQPTPFLQEVIAAEAPVSPSPQSSPDIHLRKQLNPGTVEVTCYTAHYNNTAKDSNILGESSKRAIVYPYIQLSNSSCKDADSPRVEIVISGTTGMIQKMLVEGSNVLADSSILAASSSLSPNVSYTCPSRLQLHRACTDNDRLGYLPRWSLMGLHQPLKYRDFHETASFTTTRVKKEVMPVTQAMHGLSVNATEPVFISPRVLVESINDDRGVGVKCSFVLEPEKVDRYSNLLHLFI